jgi:hypothetical protein
MNTRQTSQKTPADEATAPRRTDTLNCRARLAAAGIALLLAGCGSPGSPQPPSLKIPTPVFDLSANRTGDEVSLHWTMPRRATDRVLLAGDQRVVICRSVAPEPCKPVGELLLLAGKAGDYTDTLPASLRSGPPHLLTYTVLLQNHSRHDAGPSNVAYSAAGAAPPAVSGLAANAETRGIVLKWQPSPAATGGSHAEAALTTEQRMVRLQRTRVLAPGESPKPTTEENQAGVPQPIDQKLEVAEPGSRVPEPTLLCGWPLNHAIDRDAALNRTYRYTVQLVARVTLSGHPVEVKSVPSTPVTIDARDIFPPAVPAGLQAVSDAEGNAIDLSWTPDSDPDIAGYFVYRRPADGSGPPVKVSGTAPVVDSAWRDTAADAGMSYGYSVSAVDTSGNESARSPEAFESVTPLPADQRPPPRPAPAAKPAAPQ